MAARGVIFKNREVVILDRPGQLELIKETGVVAIVRGTNADTMLRVADAIHAGGVRAIEVTMNTPDAIDMIRILSTEVSDRMLVGVGTVLDAPTARMAILAGAQFILAPNLDEEVIRICHMYGRLVIPGVLTPTEVVRAWSLGADIVKIFPAGSVGPRYIRELRGPLGHIDMMAVGGVTVENAGDFIRAGAVALGVGSELVDRSAVAEGRFDTLTRNAKAFIGAVKEAKTG